MTPPQDSVSDVERLREPSWVRSLAFDDAAAECRRIAATFVHTDEVSDDEAKGFRIGCETAAAMLRMMAVREAPDALAVPINKIGEDARTYADGVKDAAELVEAYDTFSGTPCCDAVRDVMAVALAEQVRRLSTSTDKGVSNGR